MCAITLIGYNKIAKQILLDKVNKNNIDFGLDEWNDFIRRDDIDNMNVTIIYIDDKLNEIKVER